MHVSVKSHRDICRLSESRWLELQVLREKGKSETVVITEPNRGQESTGEHDLVQLGQWQIAGE